MNPDGDATWPPEPATITIPCPPPSVDAVDWDGFASDELDEDDAGLN